MSTNLHSWTNIHIHYCGSIINSEYSGFDIFFCKPWFKVLICIIKRSVTSIRWLDDTQPSFNNSLFICKLFVCKSTRPGLSLLLASYVLMFLSYSEIPHVKHIITTHQVQAYSTAQKTCIFNEVSSVYQLFYKQWLSAAKQLTVTLYFFISINLKCPTFHIRDVSIP